MSRSLHILGSIFALLLLLALEGCATLGRYEEPPRVSLANVQPLDMTMFEQRYRLSLRIQNPNRVELPIEGMSYDVYLNDRKFAQGVSGQPVTVAPFGEEVLEVDVVSNLLRVFEQIRALEQAQQPLFTWRIKGNLALAGSLTRLPFEYEGELNLAPTTPPRAGG